MIAPCLVVIAHRGRHVGCQRIQRRRIDGFPGQNLGQSVVIQSADDVIRTGSGGFLADDHIAATGRQRIFRQRPVLIPVDRTLCTGRNGGNAHRCRIFSGRLILIPDGCRIIRHARDDSAFHCADKVSGTEGGGAIADDLVSFPDGGRIIRRCRDFAFGIDNADNIPGADSGRIVSAGGIVKAVRRALILQRLVLRADGCRIHHRVIVFVTGDVLVPQCRGAFAIRVVLIAVRRAVIAPCLVVIAHRGRHVGRTSCKRIQFCLGQRLSGGNFCQNGIIRRTDRIAGTDGGGALARNNIGTAVGRSILTQRIVSVPVSRALVSGRRIPGSDGSGVCDSRVPRFS